MRRLSTGIVLSSIAATFLFGVAYDCPNYIVTSEADDGNGTLRACVEKAKEDTLVTGLHSDISFNDDMHIVLSSGSIKVSNRDRDQSMSIDGKDNAIVIDGNDSDRIFDVENGIELSLSNVTLQDGNRSNGGAIYTSYSTLNISNASIKNNNASSRGGGIFAYAGSLNIIDSNISANSSEHSGGGIHAYESSLSIIDSNISTNSCEQGTGGGIHMREGELTLINSTISDNNATASGGIESYRADTNISQSTLSRNSASNGNSGAINFNTHFSTTSLTISDSTLSANSASSNGGAIAINSNNGNSIVIIQNTTISGNTAMSTAGAIYLDSETDLTLLNTTITENSSNGNVAITEGYAVKSSNSILSGNINGADFDTITSLGSNILGTGTLVLDKKISDINTTDPLLYPLADNGGLTLTHLPMALSPAIDAGSSTLPTGQRGITRPQGTAPDIGSVEVESVMIVPILMYLLN